MLFHDVQCKYLFIQKKKNEGGVGGYLPGNWHML